MDGEKTEAVQVIDKRAGAMAPTPVGSTPSDLIRVALERGVTIEQMAQLIALQERMEATEARKAYVAAMAGCKAELKAVLSRDKKGDAGRYTTLGHAIDEISPVMGRHGLSFDHPLVQDEKTGRMKITCRVTHERGHCEEFPIWLHPDKGPRRNANQEIGSSYLYGRRYTLFAALGLASTDEDTDGRAPPLAAPPPETTAEQGADSRGLPDRAAKAIAWFHDALGIEQAQLERALKLPAVQWADADFRHLSAARKKLGELALADRAKVALEWFPASAEAEQPPPEPGEEG